MHSAAGCESVWPLDPHLCIAVAAPRVPRAPRPTLAVAPDPAGVRVRIGLGTATDQVELFRLTGDRPGDAGGMGPPVAVLPASGPDLGHLDTTAGPPRSTYC